MQSISRRVNGLPASTEERARIEAIVRQHGEAVALAMLGVSRPTLGRLMGGLSCQRGTLAMVRQRLDAAARLDGTEASK